MSRLRERTERDIYKEVLKKKSELYNLAETKIALFDLQAILHTLIVTGIVALLIWII